MGTAQSEETLISGYADLAAFLTQRGFRISKVTLSIYTQKGHGPPIHGVWAGRNTFVPSEALDWARSREQAKMAPRTAVVASSVAAPAMDEDAPPL